MIIILVLVVFLAVCVTCLKMAEPFGAQETFGFIGTAICLLWLFIVCISIPIEQLNRGAEIVHIKELQKSINKARTGTRMIETAAIQTEIAKANQWIAEQKYYNKTIFDLWIPDEVECMKAVE